MADPLLWVSGLCKRFGSLVVSDGIDLDIRHGEAHALIGPNGAGKTTLLRVLLGQLQPQSGTVRLGTNLQIAYFDQLRHQLREDETLAAAGVPESDRLMMTADVTAG